MEARFFVQDVQEEFGKKGEKRTIPGVLFFHLKKSNAHCGPGTLDTDIMVKAEQGHVAMYRERYTEFKKANPSFKLQWPELDVEIVEVAPVVEAPKVESEKKSKKAKE
jgi:hypothetical protein